MGTGSSKKKEPKALTSAQYKKILKQQEKSLCQIRTKKSVANGFLCKIPYPVLITTDQILDENTIKSEKEINIIFTDSNSKKHSKKIKIDETRKIYTVGEVNKENINTTIIEIKQDEDDLDEQEFMEIDENLMNDKIKNIYESKDIYLIQYKGDEEIATSNGIIYKIEKGKKSYILFHNCNTDDTSSGSPIILYNHKVIGIYTGYFSNNTGTLLQYPIKAYIEKLKNENALKENNKASNKKNKESNKIGNINKINNENKNIKLTNDDFNQNISKNNNNNMINDNISNEQYRCKTEDNMNQQIFFPVMQNQNNFMNMMNNQMINMRGINMNAAKFYNFNNNIMLNNQNIINNNMMQKNINNSMGIMDNNIMNNKNMIPMNHMNDMKKNILNICFRSVKDEKKTVVQCRSDEKVSDAIRKYREKSGDYDDEVNFEFGAKTLNPELKLNEVEIIDGSFISVVPCRALINDFECNKIHPD